MNEEPKKQTNASEAPSEKPGLFKRIFTKLDASMKEKADTKAQSSCCGSDDGKGGKCC